MIREKVREETGLIYRELVDDTTGDVEAILVCTTILPEDKKFIEQTYPNGKWVQGNLLGVNKRGEKVYELMYILVDSDYNTLKSKYNFTIPW